MVIEHVVRLKFVRRGSSERVCMWKGMHYHVHHFQVYWENEC